MGDIVDGLRKASSGGQEEWSYRLHCNNAAIEIERLRKALEASAEARMPGEARRIARAALTPGSLREGAG